MEIGQIPTVKNQILVRLELIQGYLLYRRVFNTEKMLSELEEEVGVHLSVESALGVRTKYQTKALPQLYLSVKRDSQELGLTAALDTHGTTKLPILLNLDDEVRLEKVKFEADEINETRELASVVQSLVLTTVFHIELSQPKDKLAHEELAPYLTALLSQSHGPWMVRVLALLMNIRLEASHRRTVERSLKQCEDIVHHINNSAVSADQRLSYCFAAGLLPIWKIECQLAALMLNLGLVKAALDIFLRLHQWEDVIVCYTTLQLRHKAAEIIQQEIDKHPTAKLYCLLGDATDDVSCYEKAWELSQHRSSRAQRHWGNYYFSKKEYEQSIEHLEQSLALNSLQDVVWLRLGFAALSLEKWELAARAYRRYTQIEPFGFESWNNLAKSYIKLQDKPRAHKVLQEALKCNFNNWKVWENFLIVSLDTGNFEDTLNAYSRLMELKGKYLDKEVLQILMPAIAADVPDAAGVGSARLKKKALTLLAQLGCQFLGEGVISELAAKLHGEQEQLPRALKLQQAYKVYTQSHISWTKDPKMCEKILTICKDLGEASLAAATAPFQPDDKSRILSQLSSARLTCQGCIRAASVEKWPECVELVTQLEALLEQLTEKLKQMM
jgi:tetratricopeptide (TPR) repeat protein